MFTSLNRYLSSSKGSMSPTLTWSSDSSSPSNFEILSNDVLSGRGNASKKHDGNIHFQTLVKTARDCYVAFPTSKKILVSKAVYDAVKCLNPPGRFLKEIDCLIAGGATWEEISEKEAVAKTSQALREGQPGHKRSGKCPTVRDYEMEQRLKELKACLADITVQKNGGVMSEPIFEYLSKISLNTSLSTDVPMLKNVEPPRAASMTMKVPHMYPSISNTYTTLPIHGVHVSPITGQFSMDSPNSYGKHAIPPVAIQRSTYAENPMNVPMCTPDRVVSMDSHSQNHPDDPLIDFIDQNGSILMFSCKSLEFDPSFDTQQIPSDTSACTRYKRDLSTSSFSSLGKLFKIPRHGSVREGISKKETTVEFDPQLDAKQTPSIAACTRYNRDLSTSNSSLANLFKFPKRVCNISEGGRKSSVETSQWSLDSNIFDSADNDVVQMVERSFSTLSVTRQGKIDRTLPTIKS